jgi:hypothetical protein
MTQLRFAILLAIVGAMIAAGADPHRPACNTPACRKIKAFVKTQYCGILPIGIGPDVGCDVRRQISNSDVSEVASYSCERIGHCDQTGRAPTSVREALMTEMRLLGLPPAGERRVQFAVLKSKSKRWLLAEAFYMRSTEKAITECQVIAMFDPDGHAIVLRISKLQKTDIEKPMIVQWHPLDLRDVDGDGQLDAVLQGSLDEDNWFEVHGLAAGVPRLIFSGLGVK